MRRAAGLVVFQFVDRGESEPDGSAAAWKWRGRGWALLAVPVVAPGTGEVLSTDRIEPDKSYWRNQRRDPG